ncbi:hypothetical protein KSC_002420 [Ktedonobacter sp. SOSP1-52]|uniref:phospholipase D-like domain-containing protein DpdK n=1 Tax=Ktedonobacter sp. SOSP1-52 TaxID=2778366 RepID=UPI00191697CD|nr:phospholipase D-like domain-containing protein DpdK [Ktedonobacter sp. SOSP1-52]GHO61350.1 hypothetical protein KSC_002420 [Ktedonobacter sp. SOSP1-52]
MPNRMIRSKSRVSSLLLVDCLKSLFALELLNPSEELYLFSPWLGRVVLIDNRFGQFRAAARELNKSELTLVDILWLLAERGTRIRIVCRPHHPATEECLRDLRRTNVEYRYDRDVHSKGLITQNCYLRGSMNFTHAGVYLNDENVELSTEPADIFRALQEARASWQRLEYESNSL